MAAPKIRLNTRQVQDFLGICNLGPGKLDAVATELDRLKQPLPSASELRNVIASVTDGQDARSLLRQAVGFSIGVRRDIFSQDVLSSISSALSESGQSENLLKDWSSIQDAFWRIVCHPHIRHVAKAYDLSFDYANLYQEARIITDIRPGYCWRIRRSRTFARKSARIVAPNWTKIGLLPRLTQP